MADGVGRCSRTTMAAARQSHDQGDTRGSRKIDLCESAIDALSCFQLHPQHICISTAGVRADPPWLPGLLARGFELHCGFDADDAGDAAAARMMALHPAIHRLRPPAHDWNDVVAANR